MQELTALKDWEDLLAVSDTTPFFVFKHSTTCPISASAKARVDTYLAQHSDDSPSILLVKVIESRPLSNAIAKTLDVTHQSPQLILIQNSAALWDASHHLISEENILEVLAGPDSTT